MYVWGLGIISVCLCSVGQALAAPVVIELTQRACQFLEVEAQDYAFESKNIADCIAINKRTAEQRLNASKVLHLKPGNYVFHVKNRDVPYVLGFWLRGKGLSRFTLPSVSGGGIQTGGFKDYAISLKKGEYLYSCPLNPTPDYRLLVE